MGTDIHAVLEIRNGTGEWETQLQNNKYFGRWEGETEMTARYEVGGRNYDTFAILGNVRNGHGFAGCDTGDGFRYITDCRGLPADMNPRSQEGLSDEHSASWCTVKELLDFDWTQVSVHRGWVNGVEFEKWDRMKEWKPAPDNYCGGVSGSGVEHITEQEMRQRVQEIIKNKGDKPWTRVEEEIAVKCGSTYCLISWTEQYSDSAGEFWKMVMPRLIKLGREHGEDNVRLVFDFDS